MFNLLIIKVSPRWSNNFVENCSYVVVVKYVCYQKTRTISIFCEGFFLCYRKNFSIERITLQENIG